MLSQTRIKAIIIGGGIGGVTAAIALKQAGLDVTVYERAEELQEVGSGLPLWTNALRALYELGLTDELERLGVQVTSVRVTTWNGDTLTDTKNDKHLIKLGTITIVVHRAELLALLLKTLGEDNVQLGMTCIGFTQDASGITAQFANGQEVRGDVLIGADGIHSVIRTQLFGFIKPLYVGYTCWRGLAHTTRTNLETWAWGKGCQFGITPMNQGRAYWFVQKYAPEGEADKPGGRKQAILDMFHDWHDPIPAVIDATAEADILRNDIYELQHLHHWSQGRVTLLGDAAHAMTPNLGQGACQAIEDAIALADCLQNAVNIPAALTNYEKRRVTRTNRITRLAHYIGQAVQWETPLLAIPRNIIIKNLPASLAIKQFMWILDYHPGSSM
ncbi:MAG TPA: FAD-dependent monooxygenase [Ktedonobacteraceae bacterium]|nr:FAD-dependent monooxygenase [Ktedonobacteraceae bacterium]